MGLDLLAVFGLPAKPILQQWTIQTLFSTRFVGQQWCWRVQGTCGGWNPGFGHKAGCDLAFYGDLQAVCTFTGIIMKLNGKSSEEVDDFRDDCSTAATAAYVGVSANLWGYASGQCALCNPGMCSWLGVGLPQGCCPDDPCPPEPPDRPIVE